MRISDRDGRRDGLRRHLPCKVVRPPGRDRDVLKACSLGPGGSLLTFRPPGPGLSGD